MRSESEHRRIKSSVAHAPRPRAGAMGAGAAGGRTAGGGGGSPASPTLLNRYTLRTKVSVRFSDSNSKENI